VLLRGITKLSAELGLSVTVEGVETVEQLALISAEGWVSLDTHNSGAAHGTFAPA